MSTDLAMDHGPSLHGGTAVLHRWSESELLEEGSSEETSDESRMERSGARWCPIGIAKLVNITPISLGLMVDISN